MYFITILFGALFFFTKSLIFHTQKNVHTLVSRVSIVKGAVGPPDGGPEPCRASGTGRTRLAPCTSGPRMVEMVACALLASNELGGAPTPIN